MEGDERRQMDYRTKKSMTMHMAFYSRDDTERFKMCPPHSKNEKGGKWIARTEDCGKATIQN